MSTSKRILIPAFIAAIAISIFSQPDPNFHIYLLFGQSNMAGGGASSNIISQDCDTNSRVKVLAFCDCNSLTSVCGNKYPGKRTKDTWYTAFPPLHICSEGVSPGDWFAKTMLDSIRSDIKIGLIPCALSGQALKVFTKGGSNFNIPTWAHPTLGNSSPYAWMVQRCKIAQQSGVIKGILFHQGESGSGAGSWVDMAKQIFNDLKADLGLDSKTPVIVGELRQSAGSCCASFNTNIQTLANTYPYCGLASSAGLPSNGVDPYHFNSAGMRELGKRYAQAFLKLASEEYVPRKGSVHTIYNTRINYRDIASESTVFNVYTMDGRLVKAGLTSKDANALRMKTQGLYIISRQQNDSRTALVPYINQ